MFGLKDSLMLTHNSNKVAITTLNITVEIESNNPNNDIEGLLNYALSTLENVHKIEKNGGE